jgi:hypothetical protein
MSQYSNVSRKVAVHRVPQDAMYILQVAIDVSLARRLKDGKAWLVGFCFRAFRS